MKDKEKATPLSLDKAAYKQGLRRSNLIKVVKQLIKQFFLLFSFPPLFPPYLYIIASQFLMKFIWFSCKALTGVTSRRPY